MKFQITIKQQTQAINGKAKYPLYKPTNQKNYDQDKGLQTLNQLIQNSSIKIFCNQCQKQITLQTIVIAYQGQVPVQVSKTSDQSQQQKLQLNQKKEQFISEKQKQISTQNKLSKLKITKTNKTKNKSQEKIFDQEQENEQNNDQSSSVERIDEQENKAINQQTQKLIQEQAKQKQDDKSQTIRQITHLYCVGCFACLEEFPQFYSIRKSLKFSPENSSWRLFDQICLLNGLKFWGFGNWSQIKEFMDYNSSIFTSEEIEQHYQQLYLKGDGPSFLKAGQFDITKTHKPQKRYLQDIMHQYYFPPQSQQNIPFQSKSDTQNHLKRQRPVQSYGQERKLDLIKNSNKKQRLCSLPHASKHPRTSNGFLLDANHPSNTSLFHGEESNERKSRQKFQNQLKEQKDVQSQDSEQEQYYEEQINEIQLKPKSSSILQQGKLHHMNGKVFGQSKNFGRVSHKKLQQPDNQNDINLQNLPYPESKVIQSNYSNPMLKGHNVYSYNPKRKQFEIIEYDYYAETMLGQLEFSDDDTEQEIQLKIQIIEEYNRRLDERIKRRQFVIEHRLLDSQFMIKTLKKYNKHNVRKFEPFRRLLSRNQDYYGVVNSYDTMCKAKSLTQGMIKIRRKLCATKKNPTLKDFIEYLNKKKEKKQLLGQHAKFQNQPERRVLYKDASKLTKKVVLSMSQNSSMYVNCANLQMNVICSGLSPQAPARTMTSRSQQRQRLKHLNQNVSRDIQQLAPQQISYECQNNQSAPMNANNQLTGCMNENANSFSSVLSQEDIGTIERLVKRESEAGNTGMIDFKAVGLKSYVFKSLSSFNTYK